MSIFTCSDPAEACRRMREFLPDPFSGPQAEEALPILEREVARRLAGEPAYIEDPEA